MGLFDFFRTEDNKKPSIDLTDFQFLSDDHTRIENGRPTSANNKGAWRGLKIKTSDNQTFFVTIYNINEKHPVWGDNIQMAEKRMQVIEDNNDKTVLRGFGADAIGSSFANYGLTLHKSNNIVNKATLHMYDRHIDIVYKKADDKIQSIEFPLYLSDDSFVNFVERFPKMSMNEKMQIALLTDLVSNQGADAFINGNLELAIEKFQEALKIMPTNDDALINLCRCFTKIGEYEMGIEPLKKLYYLNPNNKSKVIAYCLLMHLLEDFDFDGGAVSPSTLISFIEENFNFSTNDSEIKNIIHKINVPYDRDILVYMIGGLGFGNAGFGNSPYMTSDGTTISVIHDEIRDILNW